MLTRVRLHVVMPDHIHHGMVVIPAVEIHMLVQPRIISGRSKLINNRREISPIINRISGLVALHRKTIGPTTDQLVEISFLKAMGIKKALIIFLQGQ